MNGEINQMSNIVISARKALYDNKNIDFSPSKYVLSIKFLFAPRFLSCKPVEVDSVSDWFQLCKKRTLKDIKLLIPADTNNKHLLGFANTSQGSIVCFWKNRSVSCFYPTWAFDRQNNGWNVVYREHFHIGLQMNKPSYPNRTDEFKSILLDIEKFAADIGFPYFSGVFHTAYEAICNFTDTDDATLKQLPDNFKGIYYAVNKADVFGAMGSWNDSPPCYAHQKGLDKEYNELSNRLLIQLRHNLMYVVNECWKND